MPSNPEDDFLEELLGPDYVADVIEDAIYENTAWLESDQESYPIWSTTLYEQDQIWRTRFNLRTSEERVRRLAQEAGLYIAINDLAHE